LRMEGILPPDLQGTFLRIGPGGEAGDGEARSGALHAVELREGKAVSYLTRESAADASVFWHAGSVLALPESGLPLQYSRELEPQEFAGGLQVAIASHAHRDAASGRRVVFGVEQGAETTSLRIGEWRPDGSLVAAQSVTLERATWQHDLGVTKRHLVFIESPTEPLGAEDAAAIDYRWVPGAEGWLGVVRRTDAVVEDADTQWIRLDPCLVTHVLGAHDEGDAGGDGGGGGGGVVLYVCCYPAPEKGRPVDLSASVVGPAGVGMSQLGGGLGVLERWRIAGGRLERECVDERYVEYPGMDAACEGAAFRYGWGVEMGVGADEGAVAHRGLLKFDFARDLVTAWSPGDGLTASEPVFVRAVDGRSDDEGWLLVMVDDAGREGTDLCVLDASSFGRREPQAVVHLPDGVRLPFRSHGEWVGAELYR
jgi:all-trans-8'-apo-beta-carotenal 15,15'-oxygenase